jgi:gliding motility-associated-like protein
MAYLFAMKPLRPHFLFFLLPLLGSVGLVMKHNAPARPLAEICDNARDDDGDGLIDLNDPDCSCPSAEPISLIPNASFEEQDCCPNNRSQMRCATAWIQASAATTDFLHTCNWMGWENLPPPLPFPDGEGCIGFRNGRKGGENEPRDFPNWKEYAGACLISPLRAGVNYRFEFHVGFTKRLNSPPTNLVFYGATDCESLPFGNDNADFGCPTNGPGWERLGIVSINGANEWKLTEIEIRPNQDIAAIAIGPNCAPDPLLDDTYYFFDKLVLAEQSAFDFEIRASGNPCGADYRLGIIEADTLDYQWYRDGVALVGETRSELDPRGVAGDYQVRLVGPRSCRLAETYRYWIPTLSEAVQVDICNEDYYAFAEQQLDETGIYYDTLTAHNQCDSFVTLDLRVLAPMRDTVDGKIFPGEEWRIGSQPYYEPGTYETTLLSQMGCDSLVTLFLDNYRLYLPSAFSPNDDGINDDYTFFAGPGLETVRQFQIYDRWGSLLYSAPEDTPPDQLPSWDGRQAGRFLPSGTYLYRILLQFDDGKERLFSGEVQLLR